MLRTIRKQAFLEAAALCFDAATEWAFRGQRQTEAALNKMGEDMRKKAKEATAVETLIASAPNMQREIEQLKTKLEEVRKQILIEAAEKCENIPLPKDMCAGGDSTCGEVAMYDGALRACADMLRKEAELTAQTSSASGTPE